MITGMLYEFDEKKIRKDLDNGMSVSTGIDANSLLDTIIILEIEAEGNTTKVINTLKQNLMILLGRLKVEEKNNDN